MRQFQEQQKLFGDQVSQQGQRNNNNFNENDTDNKTKPNDKAKSQNNQISNAFQKNTQEQ